MTIMVGLLELSLLVRIGLGVRWEIKRRGGIASVTRSARIGEGSRIDLHGKDNSVVARMRVWMWQYSRVLKTGLVSATPGLFVFNETRDVDG